jgi:hypothetical protein
LGKGIRLLEKKAGYLERVFWEGGFLGNGLIREGGLIYLERAIREGAYLERGFFGERRLSMMEAYSILQIQTRICLDQCQFMILTAI